MNSSVVDPELAIAGPGQQNSGRTRAFLFLKGGISVLLMWWILEGTNFADIFLSVQSASVVLLVLGFSLPFVGYYLSASRWGLLLQAQGVVVQVAHLMRSFITSIFFNNFLPSTIGGDVFRVYDSCRLGASKAGAMAVIFVDRLLGLFALLVLTMIGLLAANPYAETIPFLSFWVFGGFVGAATLGIFLLYSSESIDGTISQSLPKVFQLGWSFVMKISHAFSIFRGKTDTLSKAFGISLLLQSNVVLQYFIFAQALHFPIPFQSFFLIIPLALFVMLLPVSINGIGLRESVFVLFLSPWGIDKPEALALAWLAYGSLVIQGMLGGILYASRK